MGNNVRHITYPSFYEAASPESIAAVFNEMADAAARMSDRMSELADRLEGEADRVRRDYVRETIEILTRSKAVAGRDLK